MDGIPRDELDRQKGEALPDREVMSLLVDPTGVLPDAEVAAAPPADTATGASASGSGATEDATDLAHADASASEGDATPTSEERSESYSNTDTAYAGP